MSADTILFVLSVFVGFPCCIAFGVFLGIRVCRRNLDGQIASSLLKQMPMVHALERVARTPVVNAKARRIERRQGTAAFCDILVMGREVTLVGANRELLEDFAAATTVHQLAIEATIRVKHESRAAGMVDGEPPAPATDTGPDLRVIDGGAK